jgi:hypothetical protein
MSDQAAGYEEMLCPADPPLGSPRSFGRAARFRRLGWGYERLPETLLGLLL